MKATPLQKLTSFLMALGLVLATEVGFSAETTNRVVEVPGIGLVEVPKEMAAQRLEQVLNDQFVFRVDPQSFKVSVVPSSQVPSVKGAVTPVPPAGSPQPTPTPTGSSASATIQDVIYGGIGIFFFFGVFAGVLALVVLAIRHFLRRFSKGSTTAPVPTAPVTPPPLQPLTLYVLLDGNTRGPFSNALVLDMVRQGQLLGETPAWKEGLADWKRLDQLVSLQPGQAAQLASSPTTVTQSNSTPMPSSASSAPLGGIQSSHMQQTASPPRLSGIARLRFGFLRTFRGLCGFFAVMQVVGLLPVFTWLLQPEAVTEKMMMFIPIKIFWLLICGGLFHVLRARINQIHTKEYGVPHPALSSRWAV